MLQSEKIKLHGNSKTYANIYFEKIWYKAVDQLANPKNSQGKMSSLENLQTFEKSN